MLWLTAQLTAISVVPGDQFAWEQTGPSLAVIRTYRFEVEVDGRMLPEPLADVQCNVAPPAPGASFECTAPVPIKLGQHLVRVRAVDTTLSGAASVEGAWSPGFFYVMRPVPNAPAKIRVVKPKT